MTSPTQDEGRNWERVAARHLTDHGLVILEHGYACRAGEIDLVCRDRDSLVFVEVRSRRGDEHGSAAATVDTRKQRRIVTTARHYLMRHPHWYQQPIRFDVVAIDDSAGREPALSWIRNAFPAG